MKRIGSLVALAAVALLLGGCALGSATAGYSSEAGTASDVKGPARDAIVAQAVAQANAHADAEIAKLRAELTRKP